MDTFLSEMVWNFTDAEIVKFHHNHNRNQKGLMLVWKNTSSELHISIATGISWKIHKIWVLFAKINHSLSQAVKILIKKSLVNGTIYHKCLITWSKDKLTEKFDANGKVFDKSCSIYFCKLVMKVQSFSRICWLSTKQE